MGFFFEGLDLKKEIKELNNVQMLQGLHGFIEKP